MKIALLGFGKEGSSVLRYLRGNAAYKNADIWVLDRNVETAVPKGIPSRLGKTYLKGLGQFDIVFRSPGIPHTTPQLYRAQCDGTKISSATKLFFEQCPARIIGITGSKGKSTTATLIYKTLKAAGGDVRLAGNVGTPMLNLLPRLKGSSWVVLELSSFQLQDLPRSPHIAVVLDTFPEHLDHHKSEREYYDSKANVTRWQKRSDYTFYLSGNPVTKRIASHGRGKKIAVSERGFSLFSLKDLKIKGAHSYRNAVMAATVAQHLGVPKKTIARIITGFGGLEHRLEFVRVIRTHRKPAWTGGKETHLRKSATVTFYNDSASTNPQTVIVALAAFPESDIILLAGGADKGLDYSPLAKALKKSPVRHIILYGENKKKIHRAIKHSGIPIKLVSKLETAIKAAYRIAKKSLTHRSPSVVLLSPGATSFDQFHNYADRGRRFKELICRLPH